MYNTDTSSRFKIKWYDIIATWFYVGKIPVMPGTFGSAAAYPLYYFAVMSSATLMEVKVTMLVIIAVLCIIGYFAIRKFHTETNMFDHKSIVIDEVIGQLLVFAIAYEWIGAVAGRFADINSVSPTVQTIYIFIFGFIPFRYFDIRKPFFIWSIDRYWKNAVGVILDDVLAGIYAAGVFYALYKILIR